MSNTFSSYEITRMNTTNVWCGSISKPDENKTKTNSTTVVRYKLHATGDADVTTGRKYVALPDDMEITSEIKRLHNLI